MRTKVLFGSRNDILKYTEQCIIPRRLNYLYSTLITTKQNFQQEYSLGIL